MCICSQNLGYFPALCKALFRKTDIVTLFAYFLFLNEKELCFASVAENKRQGKPVADCLIIKRNYSS